MTLALIPNIPAVADEDRDFPSKPLDMSRMASIDKLLVNIHTKFEGAILKVELKTKEHSPGWRYKVKVLSPNGRVLKLEYDAETLELLKLKGNEDHDEDDDYGDGFLDSLKKHWKKLVD